MSIKSGWDGRFYEDFEVGDVYRHPLGRTITESDNTWFTLVSMNPNQLHFNKEYGKKTNFGRRLVNSTLTLSIVTGLSVSDISQNVFANLGWDEVRLPNPLFIGDTLYADTKVLEKRESKSRPEVGIVQVSTRGVNQGGKVVISFKRTIMVYKRGKAPMNDTFPTIQEDVN
ncbi:MAG TPA: MaoC family dehydratase [Anaerolineales bacterium]|nr:MaoC family dehydratase [Anaerolineales bacterium]